MKTLRYLILSTLLCCGFLFSPAQTMTVAFTGEGPSGQFVRLGKVVVHNLTRGWSETLYYPDTILIMTNHVGIDDYNNTDNFALSPMFPNPCNGKTELVLRTNEPRNVHLTLLNLEGRVHTEYEQHLEKGSHTFSLQLAMPQTYLLHVTAGEFSKTVKIISTASGGANKIDYAGEGPCTQFQQSHSGKGQTSQPFETGDLMQYAGFALNNDGSEYSSQIVTQAQIISELITLHFTQTSFSCAISSFSDVDGNIYGTVQIGDQCWMNENLRTTHYSDGSSISLGQDTSFSLPYYYYPNNDSSNVAIYGLYYNWNAVMGGYASSNTIPSEVQGICPSGWHVPSDAEWHRLTNFLSTQSQYYCGSNSNDIAKSLAATSGWIPSNTPCTVGYAQNNNDATGFGARPAGCAYWYWDHFEYGYLNWAAAFWSSTNSDNSNNAWIRDIDYYDTAMDRVSASKSFCYSVRCVYNK